MNESAFTPKNRQTVVNALAIAGFVALIGGSMWLAVYSTRYVPEVVGRLGSAAVYLGSVFSPAKSTLSVIPTASTTIAFGEEASGATASTTETVVPQSSSPVIPTAGKKTNQTVQIGGDAVSAATSVSLSGLPDLIATINSVGYLATSSAESFVATTSIIGYRPAVNFTIKNSGTNATGPWTFTANIPTSVGYLYQSQPQQSLAPGDSIDYTLGFDQANKGAQVITVTADPDKKISESNEDNNVASVKITIGY